MLALALLPLAAGAQITDIREGTGGIRSRALADSARTAQRTFEEFRRTNLPFARESRGAGGACDEQVGRFCYWYDEREPPAPPEPLSIAQERSHLLALLDRAARADPADPWVAGQRVRYLAEADRVLDAIAAARACEAETSWCSALLGLAYHVAGSYAAADSAFSRALAAMPPRDRCAWRDLTLLLDDESLQRYRALTCAERAAFEDRVWWLARPLYSSGANDARTEFYARVAMSKVLEGTPSAHPMGFDKDERELLLRYSWPRAWTRSHIGGTENGGPSVVGHEPTPAARYLPTATVIANPAASDSEQWASAKPPVRARYAPPYATPMHHLEHQAAMFRRGDSALVVMAYDASADTALRRAPVDAALVLTRGDEATTTVVRSPSHGPRGVLTATAPWGPVLMSAEVLVPTERRTARARYGIRPPYSLGARVSVSDILLFEPYDTLPQSLNEAAPHALPSLKVRAGGKVGFFWESYGTDPQGEPLAVSLTVAREREEDPGWWKRKLKALRFVKEAAPVSVAFREVSARGTTVTPRGLLVDLATLTPGVYVVQLEVQVANQYVVRAERTITVQ